MSLLAWAEHNRGLRIGFTALGQRGGRPDALAVTACENLVGVHQVRLRHHRRHGGGASGAFGRGPRGVSRLTVDKASPGLKGAVKRGGSLFPRRHKPEPAPGRRPPGDKAPGPGVALAGCCQQPCQARKDGFFNTPPKGEEPGKTLFLRKRTLFPAFPSPQKGLNTSAN